MRRSSWYTVSNETRDEELQRFMSKVIINNCWEWQGAIQRYGIFYSDKKKVYAHRYSYLTFNGDIDKSKVIDHLCENKRCVNPEHLEAVTQRENTFRCERAPAAINYRKTHCNRGHEFTESNTWLEKHGRRHCRACWYVRRPLVVKQRR